MCQLWFLTVVVMTSDVLFLCSGRAESSLESFYLEEPSRAESDACKPVQNKIYCMYSNNTNCKNLIQNMQDILCI